MTSEQIRQKFLDFFREKGHRIIPSSSLLPDDPTSLFTSAGMQQFNLYLVGEKDPNQDFGSRHLASVQKCMRTADIDEVGDDTHHTFFEMLGNWSIGQDPETGYFKEGAIKLACELLNAKFQIPNSKLWATVFEGNKEIPRDEESIKIWQEQGIPKQRIKEFGMADNFWGPVTETGPCGPCSEIHYDRGEGYGCGRPECGPNCLNCQRFVEIWNLVFMEYQKKLKIKPSSRAQSEGNEKLKIYEYEKLPQTNVDTGIGLERLTALLGNKDSNFETDLFWPLIREIKKISSKSSLEDKKSFRVLADHLRASVFLICEGILPGNLARGYVLRRLLRKIQRAANVLGLKQDWEIEPVKWLIQKYRAIYPELQGKENDVLIVMENEKEKFKQALEKGTKMVEKLIETKIRRKQAQVLTGEEEFSIYSTTTVLPEIIEEIAKKHNFKVIGKQGFERAFKRHQEISRAGAGRKFGGIGIDQLENEEQRRRAAQLHTAAHLLHQALRQVLGGEVRQMGSDINPERLRFDFSFERKMTKDEIKKVEGLINEKIKQDLEVKKEELFLKQALDSGALAFFKEKYPEKVFVYTIFNPETNEVFSREICGGPHTERTSQLGKFAIKKEESSSRGVRRIKAVLSQDA